MVSTKLSLITQNSILMYSQACPFKGNLPPEYEIRYQFTVQQVGKKEAKNMIIQVTTHYKKFSSMCKHIHSKVTYFLRVHQFTVRQVGKGGKQCDHSSYHSLHKIQSYVQTSPFKGNLLPESEQVHSAASVERRQTM